MTVAHDISDTADIAAVLHDMGLAARAAARELAHATSADKNAAIEGAAAAIRDMVVRGAPAIAITAAYGLALEVLRGGERRMLQLQVP